MARLWLTLGSLTYKVLAMTNNIQILSHQLDQLQLMTMSALNQASAEATLENLARARVQVSTAMGFLFAVDPHNAGDVCYRYSEIIASTPELDELVAIQNTIFSMAYGKLNSVNFH